jgi:hypothetical protein
MLKYVFGKINKNIDLNEYKEFFVGSQLSNQWSEVMFNQIEEFLGDKDCNTQYYPIIKNYDNVDKSVISCIQPNYFIDDLVHLLSINTNHLNTYIESKYDSISKRVIEEYGKLTVPPWPYSYLMVYNSLKNKKLEKVSNNLDTKFITFVVAVKRRPIRTKLMLKSILSENSLSFCDFIVVEDVNEVDNGEQLDLSDVPLSDKVTHYKVDTNLAWTRGGLLNFGFKRSTTRLVCACDADFLFPSNFVKQLRDYCETFDFDKYVMGIQTYESENHLKFGDIYFPEGSPYGCMWVYDRENIEQVRGFNEYIVGWGFEEKDLEHRLHNVLNLGTLYSFKFKKSLFLLHLSHSDRTIKGLEQNNYNNRLLFEALKEYYKTNNYTVNEKDWGNADDTNYVYFKEILKTDKTFKQIYLNILHKDEQARAKKNAEKESKLLVKQTNEQTAKTTDNNKNNNKLDKKKQIEDAIKKAKLKQTRKLEQANANNTISPLIDRDGLLSLSRSDRIKLVADIQNRSMDNEFAKYMRNKRVVIVGPAPSVIGSRQGEIIDGYDVVVRINKGWNMAEYNSSLKIDIGTKIDVLYNCMDSHEECGGKIDFDKLIELNVQFVCNPYPAHFDIRNKDPLFRLGLSVKNTLQYLDISSNHDQIKFHQMDTQYYLNTTKKMGTRMNTGIGAILDILQQHVKELYITGFTFFQGGYIKSYRDKNETEVLKFMESTGWHDQGKQLKFMSKIFKSDKRVKLDETLQNIVDGQTYAPTEKQTTIDPNRIKSGNTTFYRTPKKPVSGEFIENTKKETEKETVKREIVKEPTQAPIKETVKETIKVLVKISTKDIRERLKNYSNKRIKKKPVKTKAEEKEPIKTTPKKIEKNKEPEKTAKQIARELLRERMRNAMNSDRVSIRNVADKSESSESIKQITLNEKNKKEVIIEQKETPKQQVAISSKKESENNKKSLKVIVGIMTTVERSNLIETLKNTWINQIQNIKNCNLDIWFITGTTTKMSKPIFDRKTRTLRVPVNDSFDTLGLKTKEWIRHCHNSKTDFDYLIKMNDDMFPNFNKIIPKLEDLHGTSTDYFADKTITWDIKAKLSDKSWITQQFFMLSNEGAKLFTRNDNSNNDFSLQDKDIDTEMRTLGLKKEYVTGGLLWDIKSRNCYKFSRLRGNRIDPTNIKCDGTLLDNYYFINLSGMMGTITRYEINEPTLCKLMEITNEVVY